MTSYANVFGGGGGDAAKQDGDDKSGDRDNYYQAVVGQDSGD